MTLCLGVLVSGSGTNLQSLIDAIAAKRLDARIVAVVSNKPDVRALDRAREAGISSHVLSHKDYELREEYDAAMVTLLYSLGVDTVVLAGFMRIVTNTLIAAFPRRVINVHPSLLPAFPGVDAQRQAFEYGAKITGCTVHFVDVGIDTGPIIAQRAVLVRDDDTVDTLRARILEQEHALLPEVLSLLAAGRVSVSDRRVTIAPSAKSAP